ncbi:MAG: DEAD/DEAH box helicase [Candidatus Lokiarchaeota archaeon]
MSDLQLTFIPNEYWTNEFSNFEIFNKKDSNIISKKSSFFLLWTDNNLKETLDELILNDLPELPIEKLIQCKINLAFPDFKINQEKEIFHVRTIIGRMIPLYPASKLFFKLKIKGARASNYSNSMIVWILLTKFVYEILNKGNFAPMLEKEKESVFQSKWKVLFKSELDDKRFKRIVNRSNWHAHNLIASYYKQEDNLKYYAKGLWHPSYLFLDYMNTLIDNIVRVFLNKPKFRIFEEYYYTEIKEERKNKFFLSWDYRFLKAIIGEENDFHIYKFHETIIPQIINNWVSISQNLIISYGFALSFHLDYPSDEKDLWPFKIYLRSKKINNVIPLYEIFKNTDLLNELVGKSSQNKENFIELILKALGNAIIIFSPLKKMVETSTPKKIFLNSEEVMNFLGYSRHLLIQNGFDVKLPDVFNKGGKQRLSTTLIISSENQKREDFGKGRIKESFFGISSILNYHWETSLSDKTLTQKELEKLVRSENSLIKWRGKWILVDTQDLNQLKAIFLNSSEKSVFSKPKGKISYIEALRAGLTESIEIHKNGIQFDVKIQGYFKDIIEEIKSIKKFKEIKTPSSFQGTLRSYQKEALSWMGTMCDFGFGLCLADDMGLGKTIEVISLLLYFKEKYPENFSSTLIICPTSLLYNWKKELKKFAPSLKVIIHHGPDRIDKPLDLKSYLEPHKVILTSYGTIRNDINLLKTVHYGGIIVDESQNIKNYETQQTQAIYQLRGGYRICLSGTPIENRLMELWTLFEFLNPGLLGKQKHFRNNFEIPIEQFQDEVRIKDLQKIIAPFMLRRIKTDKSVIKDLPEKNEMKIFIELTEIQRKLYKEIVEKTYKELENSKGSQNIQILSLLTKLKQICNHPYQYLHKKIPNNFNFKENGFISQSNKLERLLEMIDEVIERGEKVLIFSQFTQMGDIIYKILDKKYNFQILYFHGSVSTKNRNDIIEKFQSKNSNLYPILILSLRAGGTGLNLTEATTVFHYDRWWNPAVETQATDRAYRIGQTKEVMVYKFITKGTIEEKIDDLLEEKSDLVESVISSGENWFTKLNEDKLKQILTLEE